MAAPSVSKWTILDKTRESEGRAWGHRGGRGCHTPSWASVSPSDYPGGQICFLLVPTQQCREKGLVGRSQTGNEGFPPLQSLGPGQKSWPLQHQKNRATALFFLPHFGAFYNIFEQKDFFFFLFFYIFWLLFLIIAVREDIPFVKSFKH